METKSKVIALLLAALVVGGVFMTVSAENNQPIQQPELKDVKHKWFRWRWVRATYYTLRNGVEDSIDGTIVGYRSGFLRIEQNEENITMLCSLKFIVDGVEKQVQDLKDWVGEEATIEVAKIDIVGKETKTIRVVKSITVGDVVAEAVYPNINK